MSESEIFIPAEETGNTSFYKSHVRPVIVEFIGTTILVFLVCMTSERFSYLSDLVYGFATVFLIASFGDIRSATLKYTYFKLCMEYLYNLTCIYFFENKH